jgi:hypothetical protein
METANEFHQNFPDYSYVDTAFGGLNRRNNLMLYDELAGKFQAYCKYHEPIDCFATYARFPNEMTEHFKSNKNSVSDYSGSLYSDVIPIDIDDKVGLENSLTAARKVLFKLEEHGMNTKTTKIYFSGSKGFHYEIPAKLFGLEPSPNLNEVLKNLVCRLMPDIQVDPNIYDKVRLWRLPNTINSKTGLYKIQLSAYELSTLSIDEIKKMAEKPRRDGNLWDDEVELIPSLNKIYKEIEANIQFPSTNVRKQNIEEINSKCAFMEHAYQNPELSEPQWFSMISNLSRLPGGVDLCHEYSQGYPKYTKSQTDKKILHAINTPPLTCRFIKENGFDCRRDCGVTSPVVKLQKREQSNKSSTFAFENDKGTKENFPDDRKLFMPVTFPFSVIPKKFLKLIEEYSKGLQVEPELVAIIKMAVMSGVIGNTIRISPKEGWQTPIFLWVCYVAITGYGKSPVHNAEIKPVRKIQAVSSDEYAKATREYEKKVRQCKKDNEAEFPEKPLANHKLVSDITTEALTDVFEHDGRGVILDVDELAGFMLSFNQYKHSKGNDRQKWLQLFNCESWKVDRKAGSRFIKNTGAAVIGGIQTSILPHIFNGESFNDGLFPRFLVYLADKKDYKFNREGIPARAEAYWKKIVELCYQIPLTYDETGFINPIILKVDGDALELWERFFNKYGAMQAFLSDRLRVFIPKLVSYYSLKFAGLLHILDAINNNTLGNLVTKVTLVTIENSIKLTEYFIYQAVNVLQLYDKGGNLSEYHKRLIRALFNLRGEVRHGGLVLQKIENELNYALPDNLRITPHKIASLLHEFNLTTEKGAGNYSHLIWEEEKIQKIFSENNVTNVTKLTFDESIGGEPEDFTHEEDGIPEVEGERWQS